MALDVTAASPGVAPRVLMLTALAMLAFAGNSILCRLALKTTSLDAASFTALRLISGALMLWLLVVLRHPRRRMGGSWRGAAALFVYAFAFSLAYRAIDAGTGALLLFGAVQVSMLLYGFLRAERLGLVAGAGLAVALAGLLAMLLPGATAPAWMPASLMLASGVAWGVYSLLGRGGADPLAATAGNFMRAIPLVLLACLPYAPSLHWDGRGAGYALVSGALASGVGYAIWYSAVRQLPALKAATVQLSVPILATLAGIVLLDEPLTWRLALCSVAVLGGVGLVLASKQRVARQ